MRSKWMSGLLAFVLVLVVVNSVFAAVEPTYGTADVDGQIAEWDLTEDHLGVMYVAGNSSKAPLSDAYGRYDCTANVMYVLVLTKGGLEALQDDEEAWVKVDGAKKVDDTDNDDGTLPDFAWVLDNGTPIGFEASFSHPEGTSTFDIHMNVFYDDESQTSAFSGRALDVTVDCPDSSITIHKIVDGGELGPDDFEYFINGQQVQQGVAIPVEPGSYQLSENSHQDYQPPVWSGDCNAAGQVEVGEGEHKQCTVTNTAKPTTGTVLGCKFEDYDEDGIRDGGEPLLPNWVLKLKKDGTVIREGTTGVNGCYLFEDVPFDEYELCEVEQDGWHATTDTCLPASVTNKIDPNPYFGNARDPGEVLIIKCWDENRDGVCSGDEPKLGEWHYVLKKDNVEVDDGETDENGELNFDELYPGTYVVCEDLQEGWELTSGDLCRSVVVKSNKAVALKFANAPELGGLKVIKFQDNDMDGVHDVGEPVLQDWTMILYVGPNKLDEGVTNEDGEVLFNQLEPGEYTVCEVPQADWQNSNGICHKRTVGPGETQVVKIGNYQAPTADPTTDQPARPNEILIFVPTFSVN